MDSTLNIKKKAIKCIDKARQNEKKLISALQNIAISGMGPYMYIADDGNIKHTDLYGYIQKILKGVRENGQFI